MNGKEVKTRIENIERNQKKILDLLETVAINLNAQRQVQGEVLGGLEYHITKIAQQTKRL